VLLETTPDTQHKTTRNVTCAFDSHVAFSHPRLPAWFVHDHGHVSNSNRYSAVPPWPLVPFSQPFGEAQVRAITAYTLGYWHNLPESSRLPTDAAKIV